MRNIVILDFGKIEALNLQNLLTKKNRAYYAYLDLGKGYVALVPRKTNINKHCGIFIDSVNRDGKPVARGYDVTRSIILKKNEVDSYCLEEARVKLAEELLLANKVSEFLPKFEERVEHYKKIAEKLEKDANASLNRSDKSMLVTCTFINYHEYLGISKTATDNMLARIEQIIQEPHFQFLNNN